MRRPRFKFIPLRLRPALIPLTILAAFWLPGINQGGWRVDTGLYSAVARWAYESGHFFHLHVGDQPYINKPPLAFWIHGVFLYLLGPHLWVARLPALLAAMLTVLATMRLTRCLAGPRTALLSGVILATTLEFFRFTRAFSLDLWLTLFLVLALIPIARAQREDRPGLILWSGLPLGLALLTKPLIALFVPVAVALWLLWLRKPRYALVLIPATLIAIAIAAPWHMLMIRTYGDSFVTNYFVHQTFERATTNAFRADPWWTYLALLGQTYWPWLAALIGSAVIFLNPARAESQRRRSATGLALGWVALWLVALSIVADKRPRYAVPIYPLAALAGALFLTTHSPRAVYHAVRAMLRWFAPAALIVSFVLAALSVRIHRPPDPQWAALDAFLTQHRDERTALWIDPTLAGTAANIYLMTGRWPTSAPLDADLIGSLGLDPQLLPVREAVPAVGDRLVLRREAALMGRPEDEIVFESGKLVVVRLGAAWTGRLPTRAEFD